MQAGRDVLIELPLASTLEDAQHIVDAQQATAGGRSSTCSPDSARTTSSFSGPSPRSDTGR
jgi:hypothetical protein